MSDFTHSAFIVMADSCFFGNCIFISSIFVKDIVSDDNDAIVCLVLVIKKTFLTNIVTVPWHILHSSRFLPSWWSPQQSV